jgi:nucleoid-associated protein YgaU
VARAYASGALGLATEEYTAADQALREAERLVGAGKYSLAREILPFAEDYARRAVARTEEEQANREMQRIREERERGESQQAAPPRPPTAPMKQAIATAAARPPQKPAPRPPLLPAVRYAVTAGETLWSIAARREVYADPLLWPLLYQANRDQIKDPQHIYAGQVLAIPRNLSAADLEQAREKARKSDIFPLNQLLKSAPARGR